MDIHASGGIRTYDPITLSCIKSNERMGQIEGVEFSTSRVTTKF
jgi:hypothetical protein